jgi:hypothetical protein
MYVKEEKAKYLMTPCIFCGEALTLLNMTSAPKAHIFATTRQKLNMNASWIQPSLRKGAMKENSQIPKPPSFCMGLFSFCFLP